MTVNFLLQRIYSLKASIFLFLFIIGFTTLSCQTKFDRTTWLDYADVQVKNNPRQKMVSDIIANHLFAGMTRNEVINVLGPPSTDEPQRIVKEGQIRPDSLKMKHILKLPKEERSRLIVQLNNWWIENTDLVPSIDYHIGWSLIDAESLIVLFGHEGLVYEYYVKQH